MLYYIAIIKQLYELLTYFSNLTVYVLLLTAYLYKIYNNTLHCFTNHYYENINLLNGYILFVFHQ